METTVTESAVEAAAVAESHRAGRYPREIVVRGNDIGGIAVHAAARVMSHSGSDEVLVSRVVTDLVAGAGLKFAERGSFELKVCQAVGTCSRLVVSHQNRQTAFGTKLTSLI
jgi:class 3 adenylate cyclase